jgi:hypothetical protein
MKKQNIFEGHEPILLFIPGPGIFFEQFWKHIGRFTKSMGNLSSTFENDDSQWEQIFKCRLESRQRTPINIISSSMFHLNHLGNDDISSEEDFENSKIIRGSYLDLLVVIFV